MTTRLSRRNHHHRPGGATPPLQPQAETQATVQAPPQPHLALLQQELAQVQAQTAALKAELAQAQDELHLATLRVQSLASQAMESVNRNSATVRELNEREARLESELQADANRLQALLTQSDEVGARLKSDVKGLAYRYQGVLQSLRISAPALPENRTEPEAPSVSRLQQPISGGVKESTAR